MLSAAKRRVNNYALFMTAAMAALAVAVSMMAASSAHAEGWYENFCGTSSLPAKSTCASSVEGPLFEIAGERYSGAGSVCVGPGIYSGGKFSYPYGFECSNPQVVWSFTTIEAHAVVDNPNSKAIGVENLAYYH